MLSQEETQWLATGEKGLSSETMFEVLSGMKTCEHGYRHPYDPADFARCRKLIETIPAYERRISEMGKISKQWKAIVDNWDKLCAMMDEEAPEWRTHKGRAPKTYEFMRKLLQ